MKSKAKSEDQTEWFKEQFSKLNKHWQDSQTTLRRCPKCKLWLTHKRFFGLHRVCRTCTHKARAEGRV